MQNEYPDYSGLASAMYDAVEMDESVNRRSDIPVLSYEDDFTRLNNQFPFLPIEPFGNHNIIINLAANTPVQVSIPSGAKMFKIAEPVGRNVYISRSGALVPGAGSQLDGDAPFIAVNSWIYCGGMSSFSVSATQTALVTIRFYIQK